MQLASGCMWIWFADSIPALVGFLRALRFPPTPKNRYPFIFLVNSFWSLVVRIKPACLPEVWLPMCALRLSHSGALRTQWVDTSRVTKTANYYYYYYYFIDFKKAFDMVHKGKMIKILRVYGIPDIIVKAIEDTYHETKAKVITPDGETDEFDIYGGVLQGDTLAPYLFIIVLDYCLRSAINGREEHLGFTINPRRSRRVGPLMVTDLDFTDDIALVSDAACQAQELLDRVEDVALRVGLHMNAKKTQCMVFNHQDDVIPQKHQLERSLK